MDAGTRWIRRTAGASLALAIALGAQACRTDSPVAHEDPAAGEGSVVAPATRVDPAAEPPAANESVARLREAINPLPPTEDGPAGVEVALSASPTFTAMTVRPEIVNREEVMRAMEQEYPPLLREAGIGGAVRVHFFIDADGLVRNTLIGESSGHRALDEAALRVADVYRFSPALNEDERVPVWVQFNISFVTR